MQNTTSTASSPVRLSELPEINLKLLLHRYRQSKGSDLTPDETQGATRWLQRHTQQANLLDFALKGLVNVAFENGQLCISPSKSAEAALGHKSNYA